MRRRGGSTRVLSRRKTEGKLKKMPGFCRREKRAKKESAVKESAGKGGKMLWETGALKEKIKEGPLRLYLGNSRGEKTGQQKETVWSGLDGLFESKIR